MKFDRVYALKEIALILNCEFVGEENHAVLGLNEIHRVEIGDIVFVDHPKYYEKALQSAATTVLINKNVVCPVGKALLIVDEPFTAFNKLIRHFQPNNFTDKKIGEKSSVGKTTVLMHGVTIGNNVAIGEGCVLHPNVVIYDNCIIGDNVTIHANAVIGADAFYYKKRESSMEKLQTCGRVILCDEVEIGALTTVDRGVTADTIIGRATKLDNHVHIGHDTVVGEMCIIAAHTGVAGVVDIKNKVTLWGQVGIASEVVIEDGVIVYAQSGVGKDLKAGKIYFGSPCDDAKEKMKEMAYVRQLPSILEDIKKLKSK